MDEAKLWALQATWLKANPPNTKKIVRKAFIQDRCLPHLNPSVVNLLCILCSRIRTYRELLMIFFHDKHWYRSEPLFSVEEEEEEEDEDEEGIDIEEEDRVDEPSSPSRSTSPSPSEATVQAPSLAKKPEYEFLLFNYLLRFVHREGQIGEFARAGLIFLMDVAMSSGESGTGASRDENLHSPDTPISDPINDAALALAEYILEGDFSEVLGAGLGAVYSLLPSKLGFFPQTSSGPSSNTMTIGSTGMETEDENEQLMALKDRNRAMGIEDAQNSDFKSRLDHFLKLLEFLQDVLRRNVSHDSVDASALVGTAIVQSILDAVRRIFLENVLYPSILECSDTDGSAVAVMSYIEIMIRTLQPGPLSSLLVNFLIDEDNDEPRHRQRPHATLNLDSIPPQTGSSHDRNAKLRRRKSSAMVLLEMEAPESRKPSEYFTSMGRFTLRDLLLSNLRSKSQATATSALQLLQSMLVYHPELTVARLLLVIPDPMATAFPCPVVLEQHRESTHFFVSAEEDEESFRYPGGEKEDETSFSSSTNDSMFSQPDTTYSTHEREMGLYLTLISRVDSSHKNDGFSTGYDHYLRDALISIQSQPVYWLACRNSDEASSTQPLKHRLNPNDPILSRLLESMRVFFSNTPDLNITLTGVLATLAIHPDRSLAGWLTVAHDDTSSDVQSAVQDVEDDDGDDRSIDFLIEEKLANDTICLPAASMDDSSRPVLYTIFHGLINQLERYRQLVDDFDKFLLERRQGLLFSENLTDALHLSLDIVDEPKPVQPTSEITPKAKPKPPKASASSFVSFLTPKKSKVVRSPQPEPSTPQKVPSKNTPASPFGTHYQQTGSISVEPFIAPIPYTALWTPAKVTEWRSVEEDVFGSGWVERKKDEWEAGENEDDGNKAGTTVRVTLSQLLDNVVILEESIKELVAIIHARRSLGIDHLRYL